MTAVDTECNILVPGLTVKGFPEKNKQRLFVRPSTKLS